MAETPMPDFLRFSDEAAFQAAFSGWLGQELPARGASATLRASWFETPLGPLIAVSDAKSLRLLEFPERKILPVELRRLTASVKGSIAFARYDPTDQIEAEMRAYFDGQLTQFETPMAPLGSVFTQEVWQALRDIPLGETRAFGALAREMGRPQATRAVARANGANPIAIAIPCHRLVGANGALTGYGGGLWRKQALIEMERSFASAFVAK